MEYRRKGDIVGSRADSQGASVDLEKVDLTQAINRAKEQIRDLPDQGLFEPDTQGAYESPVLKD